MNDRTRGPWVQTLTGHCWYPFDPQPEDVYFADLQALARVNRFGGHTVCDGYSVAEHSVRVALRVLELGGTKLEARAAGGHDGHDGHEYASPGDQLGPFLRGCSDRRIDSDPHSAFSGFLRVVKQAEWAVRTALDIADVFAVRSSAGLIHRADLELLATERRDLMAPSAVDWGRLPEPLPEQIVPWSPAKAWDEFRNLFEQLGGKAPR